MIKLFYSDNLKEITPEIYSQMQSLLPTWRTQKADKYLRMQDRILCGYAYLLLRYASAQVWNLKTAQSFVFGKYGKPQFALYPEYYFNYSHCSASVCCALSSAEVGADIQNVENYDGMKYIMTQREQMQILQASDSCEEFTKLWTIKESYYKMLGTGLCEMMGKTDFSSLHEGINLFQGNTISIEKHPGFYIAVSSLGKHITETEHVSPQDCIKTVAELK